MMIRLLRAIERAREDRLRSRSKPCSRDACIHVPTGTVHYHWGYGQRHTSMRPVTGPNSFSDGQPFVRT